MERSESEDEVIARLWMFRGPEAAMATARARPPFVLQSLSIAAASGDARATRMPSLSLTPYVMHAIVHAYL